MSDEFDKKIDTEAGLKELFKDLDMLDAEVASDFENIAGAAGGAVAGGAIAFGALYGLGVTGLSAAGITSGLAAAGALIGGGMVAGVGVLAAPVAILGVAGYAFMNNKRQHRIRQLQRDCLAKAIEKQNAIVQKLQNQNNLNENQLIELKSRQTILLQVIKKLEKKVNA